MGWEISLPKLIVLVGFNPPREDGPVDNLGGFRGTLSIGRIGSSGARGAVDGGKVDDQACLDYGTELSTDQSLRRTNGIRAALPASNKGRVDGSGTTTV
jgi:hypothetical protein